MSLSLGIDIGLSAIFLIVLFIYFKRGSFKTLITIIKVFISLIATFYAQSLLLPLIAPYLPIDIKPNLDVLNNVPRGGVFETYFHVLVGNFISSVIIFIALYIIFTVLSNLLLNFLDRFTIARFIDKLGGALLGVVLATMILVVASYVVTVILLIYNSTMGISIIYNSFLLKNIVANNIKFILNTFINVT